MKEENRALILQIGMRVRIKDKKGYGDDSGKIKKITNHLPNFNKKKAYQLDNASDETWLAIDFSECVDYPNRSFE